ncbi:HpcH/HpaI aldolase family protein [Brucella cytisi]|uniref:HpcH/HpaI aldolase family protein n=1 Tax=Brucella cytisi TaxID=407152 RepID=UPI0035D53D79
MQRKPQGADVALRVPDASETTLKRVLDRGFHSLVVPMVNTAEQAENIVAACRYPTFGRRGYAAPIVRASQWGIQCDYARKQAAEDLLLILQCEHVESVDNLAAIAGVEGVDMIFIGPNDLAASIGRIEQLQEGAVTDLIARIESVAAVSQIPLGTILGPKRGWQELKQLGYQFIVGPSDVSILIQGARNSAAELNTQELLPLVNY